jgi:hypothetical protein
VSQGCYKDLHGLCCINKAYKGVTKVFECGTKVFHGCYEVCSIGYRGMKSAPCGPGPSRFSRVGRVSRVSRVSKVSRVGRSRRQRAVGKW